MHNGLSGMPVLGSALQGMPMLRDACCICLCLSADDDPGIQHIASCDFYQIANAMTGFMPGKIRRVHHETVDVQHITANSCG